MRSKDPYPSGGLKDFPTAELCLQPNRYTVNGRLKWTPKQGAVTAKIDVDGAPNGVKFQITVRKQQPHEPKLQYLHPDGFIRRLCVNAPHRPFSGTHKHKILPGQESAYEPDDIPDAPMDCPVSSELYREILEAFIRECNVDIGPDFQWTDPPS